MSSQDVIIYTRFCYWYFTLSLQRLWTLVFLLPWRIHICRRWCHSAFSFGSCDAGGGAQSHFKHPTRTCYLHTSLSATALLNSSRLWITTTLQRDTSKSELTAQQEATLAHFKNPSIQEPSLETCYALNVSRSKLSSDKAFPSSLEKRRRENGQTCSQQRKMSKPLFIPDNLIVLLS